MKTGRQPCRVKRTSLSPHPRRLNTITRQRGANLCGTAGVSFQTSCAPALRQDFNRGVALLHSFWFAQAIDRVQRRARRKIRRARWRTGALP